MTTLRIVTEWNGTTTLDGQATMAMAVDIATSYLRNNFAGPVHKAWCFDYLDAPAILRTLAEGEGVALHYSDETGDARVSLLQLAA